MVEQTAPNGVVTTYTYSPAGNILSMVDNAPDGSPIEEFDYTYRADGLKTSETDTLWQNGTPEVSTYSWSYDAADRLTQEAYSSYDPSLGYDDTYAYDLDGNRVGETQVGAAGIQTTTDTYDLNDRLLTETTTGTVTTDTTAAYQYGGSGNPGTDLTQVTTTNTATGVPIEQDAYTYTLDAMTAGETIDKYDTNGNLAEQDTVTYTYNSNDDRVGETHEVQTADPNNPGSLLVQSNTTTSNLFSDSNPTGYPQVVEQVTRDAGGGAVTSHLVFTVGLQVEAQADVTAGGGGVPIFLFYDGHGSTRLVTSATASIQGVYAYDAYGNPVGFDPATAATERLYAGQMIDVITGQYDDWHRDLMPGSGIFTTSDPYGGNQRAPQSYNKYAYTQGDPINGVDPAGARLYSCRTDNFDRRRRRS